MSKTKFFASLTMLATALIVALTLMMPGRPASAAPAYPGGGVRTTYAPAYYVMYSGVITQDTRSTTMSWGYWDKVDLQYIVTMGSVNTTSLTLLHSNNAGTWVTGATVASAIVASGTDMTETFNFGRFTAITATLTNNNPITLTILGWVK
jgi:hypothetical protein